MLMVKQRVGIGDTRPLQCMLAQWEAIVLKKMEMRGAFIAPRLVDLLRDANG